MAKNRTPLQVSAKFLDKLKDLQRKVRMSTGNEKSLRELTEQLAMSPIFDDIEKIIAKKNLQMDIKIKFDRRFP